jgi:hypothetical protein
MFVVVDDVFSPSVGAYFCDEEIQNFFSLLVLAIFKTAKSKKESRVVRCFCYALRISHITLFYKF